MLAEWPHLHTKSIETIEIAVTMHNDIRCILIGSVPMNLFDPGLDYVYTFDHVVFGPQMSHTDLLELSKIGEIISVQVPVCHGYPFTIFVSACGMSSRGRTRSAMPSSTAALGMP